MQHYDIIVVGAGPSAAFLAYEVIQIDKRKKVLLITLYTKKASMWDTDIMKQRV